MRPWMLCPTFAAVLALAAYVPALSGQQELATGLPAPRDGSVKIASPRGSIRVVSWRRDSVAVAGTLASQATLEFSSVRGETKIRVAVPRDELVAPPAVLEIRVPLSSHLAIRTIDAAITLEGPLGSADLESQTGSITARGALRSIYAETAGGRIDLDVSTKILRVKTVDGGIDVRGARGFVEIATVSGDVRMLGDELWETEVTTVSGGVYFDGSLDLDATFYAETHSGAIEVVLPSSSAVELNIVSVNGAVENSFVSGVSAPLGRRPTRMTLRTFKGRVTVRPRGAPTGG